MKRLASSLSLANANSSKPRQDVSGTRPKRDEGLLTPQSSVHLADAIKQSHANDPHARVVMQGSFQIVNSPQIANTSGLEPDDIVIAVMGATGSGKSTFICVASERDTNAICHTLRSHSSQVTAVRFWDQESGRHIVLVDTPGFDGVSKSDLDILDMISEWLVSSYDKKKLLTGILYLHRITDNRTASSSLKNLRLFRKLCGRDALDMVYFTTTMWDQVELSVGERRLEELKTEYWKTMVALGAQVARCRSDDDSSKSVVRQIILSENSEKTDAPNSRITPSQLPPESRTMPKPQPPVENTQGSSLPIEVGPGSNPRSKSTESQARIGVPVQTTVQPEVVCPDDLSSDDIVIVVMGSTGSGKSTFICAASEHDPGMIGHGLKSFTDQVTAIKFWEQESGRYVVLVDTPGFDRTSRSDFDILNMISDWLISSHEKRIHLSGILYLHPITSNRMVGSMLKNIRVFRKLCGKDALSMVYLTTTMWDEVELSVGEQRFEELETEYWGTMIAYGAQIVRCRSDDDSPKQLLRKIISATDSKQSDIAHGKITPLQLPIESAQESNSRLPSVDVYSLTDREPVQLTRRGTIDVAQVPEIVSIDDLNADDIVIVVVGPTGSGKSTFICSASGHDPSVIGHGLKSYTSQVTAFKFWDQESGRYVVLVDTPGFDGTSKSDYDTLRIISGWLASSYSKKVPLTGIVYLHSITSTRMMGATLRNLQVLRKLCGMDALKNVYLTTTMWDEVDPTVGEQRAEELTTKYWGAMIAQGAQIARCGGDDGSPIQLIQQIVARDAPPKVLLIQKEMVDMKKKLKKTSAGRRLVKRRRIWSLGYGRSK